jgi:hypothetical protein
MKQIICLSIFILFALGLNAQKTTINDTKIEVYDDQYSFALSNGIVNVQDFESKKSYGFLISILDDELNLVKDLVVEAPNSALHHVSLVDDQLHLLVQENIQNLGKIDYKLITIDTGNLSQTSKLLHTLNQSNHNTIDRFFGQNSSLAKLGRIDVSADKKYISLSIESRINSLKTKSIAVLFFNSDYELLFEKKYVHTWNKNKERFKYSSSFINSENKKLFVLNYRFGDGYKLESIGEDGYDIKDFNFDNTLPKSITISGKDDNFYCVGFYFNESKKEQDGIFYSKFSNNLELLEEKTILYSKQLLEQDQSKKQKKKGFSAITTKVGASFGVSNVFLNDDLEIYLLGEIQINLSNSSAYDCSSKINKQWRFKMESFS